MEFIETFCQRENHPLEHEHLEEHIMPINIKRANKFLPYCDRQKKHGCWWWNMSFLPMLYDKGSCCRGPLQSTHPHREDSLSKSWQIPARLMPRTCFEFQSHPSCCHYSSHTNHRSFPRFNESTSISPVSYNSHLPFWLLTVSCALGVNVIYKYPLITYLCMGFSSRL